MHNLGLPLIGPPNTAAAPTIGANWVFRVFRFPRFCGRCSFISNSISFRSAVYYPSGEWLDCFANMDSEQTSSESPFLPKKMLRDSFESEHPPRPFQNVSWFQRNQKCLLSNVVVIAVCVTLGAMYHHSYLGRLQCAPQSLIYSETGIHPSIAREPMLTFALYSAGTK